MNRGVLRFAFLVVFFLFLFALLLIRGFKDKSEEISASLEEKAKNCFLLAVALPFKENKSSEKKIFFTEKRIHEWVSSIKNRFANKKVLFYLPLYRTKDSRWLIAGKEFFSTPRGPVKISHENLLDIHKILNFSSEETPLTLKDFLFHFPEEELFLEVFETDERKAEKSLRQLIKEKTLFITSNNKKLLDILFHSKNFKIFYSLRYFMRFQFLKVFPGETALPGSGLVIPFSFSPSSAVIERIQRQGKMVFLKSLKPWRQFDRSLKAPVDGIIISSSSLEKVNFQDRLCPQLEVNGAI